MTSALAWLGVVVLHAAWLGVAAAAIAAIALRRVGVGRPRARHAIALGALLLVPPAAILAALGPPESVLPLMGPELAAPAAIGPTRVDGEASLSLAPATPWIGLVWALGAAWGALGLAVASARLSRLRRAARPIAGDEAERLLAPARRHLGHRGPVALARSPEVRVPTLIGWRRPVIVLPSSMLGHPPEDGLAWLLTHELAHVRRADIAWGWLQALVEAALFFHPAARWLSGQARHERECCCDAAVPQRPTDLVAYVRALTTLASPDRASLRPALSAAGGTLVNRIQRLVDPTLVVPACSRGFCLVLMLGAFAGAAVLAACETEPAAPDPRASEVARSAVFVDPQGAVAPVPTEARTLKYIDENGNEISPRDPSGKRKAFGYFTDEHGQDFAILLGPEWTTAKDAAKDEPPFEAPIPFLDPPPSDTDGC